VVRPFGADREFVEELSRGIHGEQHPNADEWRHAAQPRDGAKQYVLELGCGTAVGYACLWTEPWLELRERRRLELLVSPDHRGRGLGRALYGQLERDFAAAGVPSLEARVSLDQTEALAFLQRRGFAETARDWDLRLDLGRADLSGLEPAVERLGALGLTVTTLGKEREENPECLRRFHALWCEAEQDSTSDPAAQPAPFDALAGWLDRQKERADACFLAKAGEQYVGLSMLLCRKGDPGWVYHGATGTARKLRGCGVATALKLKVIEYAKRHGFSVLATNNGDGRPILALNERLGFRRRGGWALLEKRFNV
jgi:GNAT superfamily N-acetyltransferase